MYATGYSGNHWSKLSGSTSEELCSESLEHTSVLSSVALGQGFFTVVLCTFWLRELSYLP